MRRGLKNGYMYSKQYATENVYEFKMACRMQNETNTIPSQCEPGTIAGHTDKTCK